MIASSQLLLQASAKIDKRRTLSNCLAAVAWIKPALENGDVDEHAYLSDCDSIVVRSGTFPVESPIEEDIFPVESPVEEDGIEPLQNNKRGLTLAPRNLPPELPLTEEEIVQNLRRIGLLDKPVPLPVQMIEDEYNEHLRELIESDRDKYDPTTIQRNIQKEKDEILPAIRDPKAKERRQSAIQWEEDWLQNIEQHQEDAVFAMEPVSFAALMMSKTTAFAIIHGRNNRISVVDIGKTTAKNLLTPLAYKDNRYRANCFAVVAKCHRRETVDQTDFAKIIQTADNVFRLTDEAGTHAYVTSSWAKDKDNVHPATLRETTKRWRNNDNRPVRFQPGSLPRKFVPARNNDNRPVRFQPGSLPRKFVPATIKYPNDNRQLCVASALASSLHLMGHTLAADSIFKAAVNSTALKRDAKKIDNHFLHGIVNPILYKNGLRIVRNDRNSRYNPLDQGSASDAILQIAKLKTVRGHFNHVVAFLPGDCIVDGNQKLTLPLNADSLDLACSGFGYLSLHWSYRLEKCRRGKRHKKGKEMHKS